MIYIINPYIYIQDPSIYMIMKRKLVRQGIRALTLTVPSTWIKKNNLKAGDEIDLSETENSLTIRCEGIHELKEIDVDIRGLPPRLADRFMARSYQKGYDKIKIRFDSKEQLYAIKDKVSELMGYEILKISQNQVEIQVISAKLDLEFDILLRRMMLILLEMAETCHDAWKAENNGLLEAIPQQDFDVNKFAYFCLRELNKSQKLMTFGSSILYYLIESMEDLGDELKVLGPQLAKIRLNTEILAIIKDMNTMFRLSYEFFYKPEKKQVVEAFDLYKSIKKQIKESLGKVSKHELRALIAIEFSARIIYHLTTMRLDTLKDLSGKPS